MRKLIPLMALLLVSAAYAQTADTVILVSDTTSVDALIAKAASERSGNPVLVLENGLLDSGTRAELADLRVRTVILAGGPAVIPEETQTELESLYEVVRLWGVERTGTAMEVARYFWHGGADCAVFADDTKDSDADTEIHLEASKAASVGSCPFIPVPRGKIPAEVLDVIEDLDVTEARFVGRTHSEEFRAKFANLRRREYLGSRGEIEAEIETDIFENETNDQTDSNDTGTNMTKKSRFKLVVVAAPNWRHAFGHTSHSSRGAVVRHVTSIDDVPRLMELINERAISDVRVVGQPALADEIASALESERTNVTKISGDNAGEIAKEALRKSLADWEERNREAGDRERRSRGMIKIKLEGNLNDLENRLNHLETELAGLGEDADQSRIDALQDLIDASQRQISTIQNYIDNSNYDRARIRIAIISDDVEADRWRHRTELRVDVRSEIDEEEETLEEVEARVDISATERRLASVRDNCNTDAVDDLLEEATDIKAKIAEERTNGDFAKASELSVELRRINQEVNHLANVCERTDRINPNLERTVKDRIDHVKRIKPAAITPVRTTDAAP